MVYGCGFVSSDKMSVAGIREIAFHHSHASLLKYTARITSRQSAGKDDGGFWPPVSVSVLIFFLHCSQIPRRRTPSRSGLKDRENVAV